jgi:predicted CopG family antitoxin
VDSNYNRVTITIEKDVVKSLREIQARLIRNTTEHMSFSQVINIVLKEGLKRKNY